jgi:hypothetical protein
MWVALAAITLAPAIGFKVLALAQFRIASISQSLIGLVGRPLTREGNGLCVTHPHVLTC